MITGNIEKLGYYDYIENMPDGFLHMEIVADDSGQAMDYIFLDGNKTFEKLIGVKIDKLAGKRIKEISTIGMVNGFNLIEIFERFGPQIQNLSCEQYSENLKKWYLIYSYKSEANRFYIIFHDITETKNRTENINILYESSIKFHETAFSDIDYQWIADEIRKISGALFVLVNVIDKDKRKTVTQGFSGLSNKVKQCARILNYEVVGKSWEIRETDIEVMKSKKLVNMGMLHEYNLGRIPTFIVNMIEKILKFGTSYGIGMTHNGEILGSFILITQHGEVVKNPDIVELFVNQLGIMLVRKKAEEEVVKIDQEYRTVFNGSQDAMFLVNVESENKFTYHMINKGYGADVGITSDNVKGFSPSDLFGEFIGRQIENHYIDCILSKESITYEETYTISGIRKVWHTLLSPIINGGKVMQIVGSSRNITKLKEWEDEVARERQLFKVTLHSIGDAVITTDTANRIVMLNKVAEALTGWNQCEAEGKLLTEVLKTHSEKKLDLLEQPSPQGKKSESHVGDIKILTSKSGNKKIISSIESSIRDENSNILGTVIVFRDVTFERHKEEEVRYLGYHDKLTGLFNRAYFEEALIFLDDEEYLPLGIIMGDSNGLKMVNDVFGHEEGDKLLKKIGEIFKTICRNDDIVARVGGDEFAIILPRTSPQAANSIVSRIKLMCGTKIVDPISPSIALGVAIKNSIDENIKEVYKQAEDRMYNNKLMESKSIRSSIISSLKKTLEERTHETEAHAQRLKDLSIKIGKIMNLFDNELDELSLLAMLHDIGKIAIPDFILGKPGKLTDDEWKIMKSHCEIGYRIAVASPELAHIANLILSHHERWDGKGYPQGLSGEEIPMLSRIIAVADAYDAMTSDRPYHSAVSSEAALKELERCSGTQFDPTVVEKFITVISNIMSK